MGRLDRSEYMERELIPCLQQKLPLVGDYFVKEIPPSDNVSLSFPFQRTGRRVFQAADVGCFM